MRESRERKINGEGEYAHGTFSEQKQQKVATQIRGFSILG